MLPEASARRYRQERTGQDRPSTINYPVRCLQWFAGAITFDSIAVLPAAVL